MSGSQGREILQHNSEKFDTESITECYLTTEDEVVDLAIWSGALQQEIVSTEPAVLPSPLQEKSLHNTACAEGGSLTEEPAVHQEGAGTHELELDMKWLEEELYVIEQLSASLAAAGDQSFSEAASIPSPTGGVGNMGRIISNLCRLCQVTQWLLINVLPLSTECL